MQNKLALLEAASSSDVKLLSFNSLQKARTTIEDFCLSYFPLHGLKLPEDFLKYWDVLCYVESVIYSLDNENEQLARAGHPVPDHDFKGETVLRGVLRELGLLSYSVELQLIQGKLYWQLERQICSQLLSNAPGSHRKGFTTEELHKASEAKSFDYRLLNHLLFALRGAPMDRELMQFLFVDEHLVDIGDDLHDYEDDVLNNSFNIYRGYIHLYGSDAQLHLAKRISDSEERHQRLLGQLISEQQDAYAARRKTASAVPGSEKWVFPQPILDEAAYRKEFAIQPVDKAI